MIMRQMQTQTRMHSSRMCTACLLTVTQHALLGGTCPGVYLLGLYLTGGCTCLRDVPSRGCTCLGSVPAWEGYLLGGTCQGVPAQGGVSALQVYLPRGYLLRYPPSEQNDR